MKKILIKNVKIVGSKTTFTGKTTDLLIVNGKIEKSGKIDFDEDFFVIEIPGLHASSGWFDMQADFKDPGYEYKEDLDSGSRAAAAGGFTGVALLPTTFPVVDSKSQVEYIKRKAPSGPVDLFPMGTISEKGGGKELAELYDMSLSGAVAFTDGKNPVMDSDLLVRALMYSSQFGKLIISFPEEKFLAGKGQVNESLNTLMLGMKGVPSLAEELMVSRDIALARYAGARIHFATISTQGSVEIIRRAKSEGLPVTAGVAVYNLFLDDSMLSGFDSNYKVKPPLRSKEDVEALRKAVADGVIDIIVSDHNPQNEESKVKEFELSEYGMISLETCFAIAAKSIEGIVPTDKLCEIFSENPRKILGLPIPKIEKGETANLSLFVPGSEWNFSLNDIFSKSKNTPFIGESFKLKPAGVINNGYAFITREELQKAKNY